MSCCASLRAADGPRPVSPILDPDKEGRELADKLRSAAPAENSEFTGVFEITDRHGKVRLVPVSSAVTVSPTRWQVVYQTAPTDSMRGETLVITHQPGERNRYTLSSGATSTDLASNQLARPFGGTDFWVMDLGLEFIHWPQQRAIRSEMSRGRPCRVLESVTSQLDPDGYGRVLSCIDLESGGVLKAEAYDAPGKLLKRFALGSFEKVEGQWQLRNMKIRNVRTDRQTELKFDFRKEE
jgi:hypothetical protein